MNKFTLREILMGLYAFVFGMMMSSLMVTAGFGWFLEKYSVAVTSITIMIGAVINNWIRNQK